MRRIILFFVLFLCVTAYSFSQEGNTITTFILVRHAEKGNDGTDDPDLKSEGVERANEFAQLFKNSNISTIYATRFKRTRNTVAPLAKEKNLDVNIYEAMKPQALDDLLRENAGETIVVAGHSNTIPQIANLLLGKEEFQNFPDTEYGTILIVSVVQRGKGASVVRLTY